MDLQKPLDYEVIMEKTDPLICVQVSVYALDGNVREAVYCYLEALDSVGVSRETGSMSTMVWGTGHEVWHALQVAYNAVSKLHPIIVNTSMSNAAPLPAKASGSR